MGQGCRVDQFSPVGFLPSDGHPIFIQSWPDHALLVLLQVPGAISDRPWCVWSKDPRGVPSAGRSAPSDRLRSNQRETNGVQSYVEFAALDLHVWLWFYEEII